jgi:uncharacterized protein
VPELTVDIPRVLRAVLQDYALPWTGFHGITHWARVLENAERLANVTGANLEVISLFAVLHDSQRTNEGHDPQHGARAAAFAAHHRGTLFELPDELFSLLQAACAGHTHERTHPDVTVQTCWDADRLDLGRVGITPHPSRLCTDAARQPEMIRWADGRAAFELVPDLVTSRWGIDLRNASWQR